MKKIMTALMIALALPAFAAVTGEDARIEYTANGSTTVYTFGFKTPASSYVKVYVDGVLQSSGYVVALYPLPTLGGTVTFTSAPANGKVVRIDRTLPLTQTTTLPAYAPFKAKTVEEMTDNGVLISQQLGRKDADLAAKDAALQAEIDAEEATRAAADAAEAATRAASDSVEMGARIAGDSAEAQVRSTEDSSIRAQVASAALGGGVNIADTSTVLAPGSSTARTLSTWFGDQVNVVAFGAIPDDGIDDAPAINAALAYSKKSTTWGTMGKGVVMPAGVYDTFSTISIPWDFYKWRISGLGGYAVINAHGDFDTMQIDAAGGIMENMQIGRSAPSATGVGLNVRAPENRFLRVRVSGGHHIGIESNGFCRSGTAGCVIDTVAYRGSHMNYYQAVQIDTANNGIGMNDRGRSIANDFVACNIINNTDGWIWRSGDFHWLGGQLEQNYQHDILCSTTPDESGAFGCSGVFLGTHFEAHTPGGPTDAMAVLGPPDQTSDRVFVVFEGNPWAGNSITGAGVRIQGAGATFIGNRFRDFNLGGGHSVVEIGQYARRVTFLTNQYATAQPHKSIHADAGYILDFEEDSTGPQSASLSHSFGSGGVLAGIGVVRSAPRPDVGLRLESKQSAPNAAAFAVATTLADNTTLIDRIDVGGGEAVPWVSFYNSKVRLSATYSNPLGCGMDRYCWWDNSNNLRAKKASAPGADMPADELDGRIIGSTDHSTSWGTGAPDTSGWARGDVIWNTGAAAGGAPGWMCVNAGGCSASAHWKAMANLAP